jgi:transcriptional regulator with XRE-family HTH domain
MARKDTAPIDAALAQLGDVDPDLVEEIGSWNPVVGIVGAMVEMRRRIGLTQAQLADRLGKKQSAIARLESGEQDPRWSTVHEVLAALGQRIQLVPAEGDLYLLTDAQIQDIVQQQLSEVFQQMQREAMATALVRLADVHKATKAAGRERAEELVYHL